MKLLTLLTLSVLLCHLKYFLYCGAHRNRLNIAAPDSLYVTSSSTATLQPHIVCMSYLCPTINISTLQLIEQQPASGSEDSVDTCTLYCRISLGNKSFVILLITEEKANLFSLRNRINFQILFPMWNEGLNFYFCQSTENESLIEEFQKSYY